MDARQGAEEEQGPVPYKRRRGQAKQVAEAATHIPVRIPVGSGEGEGEGEDHHQHQQEGGRRLPFDDPTPEARQHEDAVRTAQAIRDKLKVRASVHKARQQKGPQTGAGAAGVQGPRLWRAGRSAGLTDEQVRQAEDDHRRKLLGRQLQMVRQQERKRKS